MCAICNVYNLNFESQLPTFRLVYQRRRDYDSLDMLTSFMTNTFISSMREIDPSRANRLNP